MNSLIVKTTFLWHLKVNSSQTESSTFQLVKMNLQQDITQNVILFFYALNLSKSS